MGKIAKFMFGGVMGAFIAVVIALNLFFPFKYAQAINKEAAHFNVEKDLVYAVIWAESKFNPNAESRAGAVGLMQLMPSTAAFCAERLGEEYSENKLSDPDFNIRCGVYYLRYLIDKFGNTETALAAYNAGEGNVLNWDGEIKFKETRDYIKRVKTARGIYRFKLRR